MLLTGNCLLLAPPIMGALMSSQRESSCCALKNDQLRSRTYRNAGEWCIPQAQTR